MRNCVLICLTFILFIRCAEQPPISGVIEMTGGALWQNKVYLLDPVSFDGIATNYLGQVIDSATIDEKGYFYFSQLRDYPETTLLELCVQKKGEAYANKLENEIIDSSNYFPILWKNGDFVQLNAAIEIFQKSITLDRPSVENEALIQLRNVRQASYQSFASGSSNTDSEADLLSEEKAISEFQRPLMEFAEKTPFFLPALVAVRWVTPDANYERIPEFIFGQCHKWKNQGGSQSMVAQLCHHARPEALPVMIGQDIPDFPMPMLEGDTLLLRELLGEKLTILDLWASWCIPCRHENRDYLVPVWDEYHKKGLKIIGYALDASEKIWRKAIEKDGADRWQHASHLQGDEAPLFQELRIVTIPANFIIDGRGKVVAKNLHGEDLVKFVDTFMSQ